MPSSVGKLSVKGLLPGQPSVGRSDCPRRTRVCDMSIAASRILRSQVTASLYASAGVAMEHSLERGCLLDEVAEEVGCIEYHRGHVTIRDPEALEDAACEDYRLAREAYDRAYAAVD